MGTDSVKLFNKILSDEILALSKSGLISFVEKNLEYLNQKEDKGGSVRSLIIFKMKERSGSVAEAMEQLIKSKNPLKQLKEELIEDLAFGEDEIYLDYWGCYVEVFKSGRPAGSLSSIKYVGHKEELYLFLKPSHIEQMIRSLKKHFKDLRVMGKVEIEKLEYFRDFCKAHPGFWVAYLFDF